MRFIKLKSKRTDVDRLRGDYIDGKGPGWTLIDYSCTAIDDESRLVFAFGKRMLSSEHTASLYQNYKTAAIAGTARGDAAGPIRPDDVGLVYAQKNYKMLQQSKHQYSYQDKSGKKSTRFARVRSGCVGWIRNNPTRWTRLHWESIVASTPALYALSQAYKKIAPTQFRTQTRKAKSHDTLPRTVFSTLAVNRNFRTGIHRDRSDEDDCHGVMTVLGDDKVIGGQLLLPEYKICIDVRVGDVIVFNSKLLHGNAPMKGKFDRLSIVAYLHK